MQQRRAAVAPARAAAAGQAAAGHLAAAEAFRACGRAALYASAGGELPSQPLYQVCREADKVLLWPRVLAGGAVGFAPCARWEDLEPGRYGVLEPPRESAATRLSRGDLVLVPGLAFDAAGRRLGRGGGHYDRALEAASPEVVAVGVGYEFQRVAQVPAGPLDRRIHGVLTEAGLFWVRER